MGARLRIRYVVSVSIALLALAPCASAYYLAGTSPISGNGVRFYTWALSDMDTNHDGDVSGPNEGIPITFESGDLGFTLDEMDILRQAFAVWQNVPTTYAAFRFTDPIPDPLEEDATIVDGINFVAIQFPEDPVQVPMGAGIVGFVLTYAAAENGYIPSRDGTFSFPVSGGQIFESDIVMNGPSVRASETEQQAQADLLGITVIAAGQALGLAYSSEHNVEFNDEFNDNTEEPAVALRGPDGQLHMVGVTSSMLNMLFKVVEPGGTLVDGHRDLAPSDIAAVSALYPRGSQDGFFSVRHEARTFNRANFPSYPMLGCLITAWCDADNNPATPRVPFMQTITGLYQNVADTAHKGYFEQRGLFKQLETVAGEQFQVSYVFTVSAIPGSDPIYKLLNWNTLYFDSTHGGAATFDSPPWTVPYEADTALFPTEVFREGGNLFGLDNRDQGTPLVFDPVRRKVISANSEKTLDQILPGILPMFGDPNTICPYNLVYGGLATQYGPTALRKFRDQALLNSAVGVALVDAYYRVSPALAGLLLRHVQVLRAAQETARMVEWSVPNYRVVVALLAAAMGLIVMARRARKARALVFGGLAVVAFLGLAGTADALIATLTTAELVQLSDAVIEGQVVSTESHWVYTNGVRQGIVTDVTVNVIDLMKGRLNKSATIQVRMPGGRVDNVIASCADMPQFEVDEHVVLFLQVSSTGGYILVAGTLSKANVMPGAKAGESAVVFRGALPNDPVWDLLAKNTESQAETDAALKEARKTMLPAQPPRIPLDDYKKLLRGIVRDQEKADSR